jgi:ribosome maturation factor RimP
MSSSYAHVADAVKESIRSVVESEGMELVAVEYRRESYGWILRVYIDRAGGVTINDCSAISSQLGDVLDVQDAFLYPYTLEVSSPGLNRPLQKEEDFKKCVGETVCLTTQSAIEGRKNFKGTLLHCADGALSVAIDGKEYVVPCSAVRKAHLEYDFTKSSKQKQAGRNV